MERMRITYVVTVAMTAGAFLRGQLRSLVEGGAEVTLISAHDALLDHLAAEEQVTVVAVPMEREISPRADLQSIWQLYREFRRIRPDITNVGTPKAGLLGGLAAFFARVPRRIYTLHGLRMETATGLKRLILSGAEKLAMACAHEVVCVSPSLRARAIELGLINPQKATVIAQGSVNGVDAERFSPTPLKQQQAARGRTNGFFV